MHFFGKSLCFLIIQLQGMGGGTIPPHFLWNMDFMAAIMLRVVSWSRAAACALTCWPWRSERNFPSAPSG